MTEENYVEPIEFSCAKKFLDALDETNERWRGETWLYRGQNEDLSLLPTALRDDDFTRRFGGSKRDQLNPSNESVNSEIQTRLNTIMHSFQEDRLHAQLIRKFLDSPEVSPLGKQEGNQSNTFPFRRFNINWQLAMERSLFERFWVRAFINLADQVGLKVPRDSFDQIWNMPFSFSDLSSIAAQSGKYGSEPDPEEITTIGYALARHHRAPTRLLDFTYRPMVAAFFAAYLGHNENESDLNRQLIVWAIRENALHDDLRIVKHRRGEIGFLQAQEGVFLLDTLANEKYWFAGEWLPLEYYFVDMVDKGIAYKFSFPFSKRRDLLELLGLKGINMPSLQPSFDNVWEYLKGDLAQIIKIGMD